MELPGDDPVSCVLSTMGDPCVAGLDAVDGAAWCMGLNGVHTWSSHVSFQDVHFCCDSGYCLMNIKQQSPHGMSEGQSVVDPLSI